MSQTECVVISKGNVRRRQWRRALVLVVGHGSSAAAFVLACYTAWREQLRVNEARARAPCETDNQRWPLARVWQHLYTYLQFLCLHNLPCLYISPASSCIYLSFRLLSFHDSIPRRIVTSKSRAVSVFFTLSCISCVEHSGSVVSSHASFRLENIKAGRILLPFC